MVRIAPGGLTAAGGEVEAEGQRLPTIARGQCTPPARSSPGLGSLFYFGLAGGSFLLVASLEVTSSLTAVASPSTSP